MHAPSPFSPSTPTRRGGRTPPSNSKATNALGAKLMQDVERALARLDPSDLNDTGHPSPSERRVVTTLQGQHGLARLDLTRNLVSRAACDALAELQRRLDETREERDTLQHALIDAKAESANAQKSRMRERDEWLANRDAVRKEIKLARDKLGSVKEEHRRNLLELAREREMVNSQIEETNAARDETRRAKDEAAVLKKRLANSRKEIVEAHAELAARDDLMDTALAANAKNAAIAARNAFRRKNEETNEIGPLDDDDDESDDDDDDFFVSSTLNPSTPPSPSGHHQTVTQSIGNPEPFSFQPKIIPGDRFVFGTTSHTQKTTTNNAYKKTTTNKPGGDDLAPPPVDGSRADWSRAFSAVAVELETSRARCAELEAELLSMGKQSEASGYELSELTERTETTSLDESLTQKLAAATARAEAFETRAVSAERKFSKIAGLNASLLDRYGELLLTGEGDVGRHGDNGTGSGVTGTAAGVTGTGGRVLFQTEPEARLIADDTKTTDETVSLIETIEAMESEVRSMDQEYRAVVSSIRDARFASRDSSYSRGVVTSSSSQTVVRGFDSRADALAGRANALEDAIVGKIETIQALRVTARAKQGG
jgi:hypothetical protein